MKAAAADFADACKKLRERIEVIEAVLDQLRIPTGRYWVHLLGNEHDLRVFDGTSGHTIVRIKHGDTVCRTLKELDNGALVEAAPAFARLTQLIIEDIEKKRKKIREALGDTDKVEEYRR